MNDRRTAPDLPREEGSSQGGSESLPEGDPRRIHVAQGSHIGQVRKINQDDCDDFVHPTHPMRLAVTADGMGGHRGGEVASRLVIEAARETFTRAEEPSAELARSTLAAANARIHETSSRRHELEGMGSTGVAALFGPDGRAWIVNVGDSRAYRLREGRFEQLTRDDSVVADLVEAGAITPEEARLHPRRNELRRALGVGPEVEIQLYEIPVLPGDRYLLCTDGLWGLVSDAEMGQVISECPPDEAVRVLMDRANEEGGTDNVTLQIAAVPGEASSALSRKAEGHGVNQEKGRQTPARVLGIVTLLTLLGLLIWRLLS
jgi:protein phosphatase